MMSVMLMTIVNDDGNHDIDDDVDDVREYDDDDDDDGNDASFIVPHIQPY